MRGAPVDVVADNDDGDGLAPPSHDVDVVMLVDGVIVPRPRPVAKGLFPPLIHAGRLVAPPRPRPGRRMMGTSVVAVVFVVGGDDDIGDDDLWLPN